MYEEITQIIERYRAADNTDYAVVLNGEWGCGKTYYVEHTLRGAIEASGGHILYASLHGARDYDQVATQLMLSNLAFGLKCKVDDLRDEYWLGKVIRVIKDSGATRSKVLALTVDHWLNKTKSNSYKVDKDATLVVIDDIERAINDEIRRHILGTLYEEYIRRGYHVLLIGDETKIDKNSQYYECKEKYVRRTINVSAWQSDLVFDFAKSRCRRLDWLYEAIENQLKAFVRQKNIANLRVVAMIIDAVIDIVVGLEDAFSKNYAKFIFSATAPLVHAMSCGSIRAEDAEDYAGLTELQNVLFFYSDKDKRTDLDSKMLKACSFFDEYCRDECIGFCLVKSIFRYVLTGYLDTKSIQKEISELFKKSDSPEGEVFKKLGDFWTSEEEEIEESVHATVGFLEEGKYGFDEIVSIYQRFVEIKARKYISVWPYEDNLSERFLRYIRIRSAKEVLPSQSELLRMQAHREISQEMARLSFLYDEIDAFYKQRILQSDCDRVDKLFIALKNRDRIEAEAYVKGLNGRWKLFADIVEHGKLKDVAALPVMGLKFLEYQAQEHILGIINSADYEKDQIPSINEIIVFLEDYVKDGPDKDSRKARIMELVAILKKSIKYMEDYIKSSRLENSMAKGGELKR